MCTIRNKADKIALWLGPARQADAAAIGRSYKNELRLNPPDQPLTYELHEDSMRKTGSAVRALIRI